MPVLAGLCLIIGASLGCTSQPDTTPRDLGPPEEPAIGAAPAKRALVFLDTIAIPTTNPATAWLSRPGRVSYDATSKHLFTADNDRHTISEFDLLGRHLREFGTLGQGPGEIANLGGYAITPETVFAVDNGNGKLLRFDRASSGVHESRLYRVYYGMAVIPPDTVLLLPGGETLFDVVTGDGQIEGFGAREAIPGPCHICSVVALDDGRVIVADPLIPELFAFDRRSGELQHRTLVVNMLDELRAWYREEGAIFEAGGSKVWVTDMVPIGGSQLAMAIAPANVIESGRELWRVDLTTGQALERLTWTGPEHVGRSLALVDSSVVTLGFRDGGVYRYQFPEGSGWSAVGRQLLQGRY